MFYIDKKSKRVRVEYLVGKRCLGELGKIKVGEIGKKKEPCERVPCVLDSGDGVGEFTFILKLKVRPR